MEASTSVTKKYFSVVLLAIVDAEYDCLLVWDRMVAAVIQAYFNAFLCFFGAKRTVSSIFYKISHGSGLLVFVGDEAFGIGEHLVHSYFLRYIYMCGKHDD